MENSLNEKIYSYSLTTYKKRTKVMVFFLGIVVGIPCLLLFISCISVGLYLFPVVTVVPFIFGYIYWKTFGKKLGSLKLRLSEEYIERFSEKMREKIFFRDITHLVIIGRPNNKIGSIIIETKSNQWHILEFEQMEEIGDLIRKRIGPNTKIETRQQRMDWQNPNIFAIGFTVMLLIVIVILLLIQRSFGEFWRLPAGVVFLINGFYYITRKPLVQLGGMRFKKNDIIIGIISLVAGITYILLCIITEYSKKGR